MGANLSSTSRRPSYDVNSQVSFDHFQILRAIGKGSFGKGSPRSGSRSGTCCRFEERRVKLYVCELALALDYLRQQLVVHRDIKPDNILLDEEGHAHITDFNVAVRLPRDTDLVTSLAGTKPYMAPEVFTTALGDCDGYSFCADWWSLAVCVYEMLRGIRPYEIHSFQSETEIIRILMTSSVHMSSSWDAQLADLLSKMLSVDASTRLCTLEQLQTHPYMSHVDFDEVLQRRVKPVFIPSNNRLNCDPTYELEEMIVESKPLHKKKQRLAKREQHQLQLAQKQQQRGDPMLRYMAEMSRQFQPYNRERETGERNDDVDGSTKT